MKTKILFITGWAHNAETIRPLADAFEADFSIEIRTGAEVLERQLIPPCDAIVTGSMGGLLAMERLPDSCRKLVLISSTAKFCADENYPCGIAPRALQRMITQLKRQPEAVLDAFFKNVHFPHKESRMGRELRTECGSPEQLLNGLEYLLNADVRDKLAAIRIPVLLLHGESDRIIPPEASEFLHTHLANSRLRLLPDQGHALAAHQFTAVTEMVRNFLTESE